MSVHNTQDAAPLTFNPIFYAAVIILVAAATYLQYRYWLAPDGLPLLAELSVKIEQREGEFAAISSRNRKLLVEIEAIKSSRDAIEELARTKFGLIKDGESFYRFSEQFLDTESRAVSP